MPLQDSVATLWEHRVFDATDRSNWQLPDSSHDLGVVHTHTQTS
jgi:hypothetical protein